MLTDGLKFGTGDKKITVQLNDLALYAKLGVALKHIATPVLGPMPTFPKPPPHADLKEGEKTIDPPMCDWIESAHATCTAAVAKSKVALTDVRHLVEESVSISGSDIKTLSHNLTVFFDCVGPYAGLLTDLAKRLASEIQSLMQARLDALPGIVDLIVAVDSLGAEDEPPFQEMAALRKSSAGVDLKNLLDEYALFRLIGLVPFEMFGFELVPVFASYEDSPLISSLVYYFLMGMTRLWRWCQSGAQSFRSSWAQRCLACPLLRRSPLPSVPSRM